jgi:hypothetical protein
MSQFMHCHDTAVYIDCCLGLVYVKLHVFRVMVMLRFLSRGPVCLAFPPPLLLFTLNLPCRLEDAADALSGMVNSDWLLLRGYLSYLLHVSPTSAYHVHCETRTCKAGSWKCCNVLSIVWLHTLAHSVRLIIPKVPCLDGQIYIIIAI